MSRRTPRAKVAVKPEPRPRALPRAPKPEPEPDRDESAAALGEFLRKAALGLAAMLFVTRAYFPSEDADTGSGLFWVFAVLATTALAVTSSLLAGTFRFRWSWADAAVLVLVALVASSASHALERRPAITMAWEWGGLGLLYFLLRNLPRTRGESAVLVGAVVATAVAVALYGLYQLPFEFPQLRALYLKNPEAVLMRMGIPPGSPSARALENRLMNSNDVFSTFALANSLAGFLVGPMALSFAVALENLRRDGRGSRLAALALASLPGLVLLACLVCTKSRSAWVGLALALLVLAWRARRALPTRVLVASGLSLAILLGTLVVAGVRTRQLDIQVLTESTKSLRYRWEYWVGAWGVITDAPSPFAEAAEPARPVKAFWWGLGPANFAMPYLAHKLPEASEEVQDPHNMVLDVWSTAGAFAMLALLAAIAIGLRETLGPGRDIEEDDQVEAPAARSKPGTRARSGWLLLMAGLGWLAVWAFGKLNPMIYGDLLARWLVLGVGWALAVALAGPLWRRRPIPAAGLGVGVLAISVDLLAAGGIGIPSVAMALWAMLAIGLNLREDRPCGRLREVDGIWPAVLLACVWAALAGTFYGAVMPFWRSESDRALGDALMESKPPAYELARKAYLSAIETDRYNVKPFLSLADLEYAHWRSPEMVRRKEPRYMEPIITLTKALDGPGRSPINLGLRRRQAGLARQILRDLPDDAPIAAILELRSKVVQATRWITRIYPTSAPARAELAEASADIGDFLAAAREGQQALKLDRLTPHLDKKLPPAYRKSLEAQVARWEEKAKQPPRRRTTSRLQGVVGSG